MAPHHRLLALSLASLFLASPLSSSEVGAAAMNKADLIDAVARDAGLSKADAKRALETFAACAGERLADKGSASLPGFGTFFVLSGGGKKGYDYYKAARDAGLLADPDDDGDGFCDGLDNDCDYVLDEATDELKFACPDRGGADGDGGSTSSVAWDGLDDDCSGPDSSLLYDAGTRNRRPRPSENACCPTCRPAPPGVQGDPATTPGQGTDDASAAAPGRDAEAGGDEDHACDDGDLVVCGGDDTVYFQVDRDELRGLNQIWIERYWTDVVGAFSRAVAAQDYNSSRSNNSSSRRNERKKLLRRALVEDNPIYNDPNSAGTNPLYEGTFLGASAFWTGAVDLSLKEASVGETSAAKMEIFEREVKKQIKTFVDDNYPTAKGKGKKQIIDDMTEFWTLACRGSPDLLSTTASNEEEEGNSRRQTHASIDVETSDQIEILTCMEGKFLDDDSDGNGIPTTDEELGHANVALILLSIQDGILDALAVEAVVAIQGFGSFSISERAARVGRDPQTGRANRISALSSRGVVQFTAGHDAIVRKKPGRQ